MGLANHVKEYSVEQFFNTSNNFNCSFSHDEQLILFSSNRSGINNAYTVPVEGGPVAAVTRSVSQITNAVGFFPNDSRIVMVRDTSGSENYHVQILEEDGRARDLSPGVGVTSIFLGWSGDESSLFYASNERERRVFDVYRLDTRCYVKVLVFTGIHGLMVQCVSACGRYIVLSQVNSKVDSDLYLYEVGGGESVHLTPHDGRAQFGAGCFDRESRYLYFLTDVGREFAYLMRYELATGKRELVATRSGDILWVYFSPGGKYRIISVSQDGRRVMEIINCESGEPVVLEMPGEGYWSSVVVSRSEDLLVGYVNGDRVPSTLYVYDFRTKVVRRLVKGLSSEIDPEDLVESESIGFRSFDDVQVPAFLWKPHGASAEHRVPGIVWVHGGPGGQTSKGYSGRIQLLVNRGYAVLGVNYRGSAGYGKTFFGADERKHGREPLWDCVAAKNYLASLEFVEPSKIGIMGASYGGYMVLAALAFAPEEFAVGVDLFGASNLARTIASFPAQWVAQVESLRQSIGDPGRDAEELSEISPVFHAEKITKPLMVVQGAKDPRVLRIEADEMVDAVRQRNGVVEYLVFEDEGHGLSKRENKIKAYSAVLNFLERYLRGRAQPTRARL